MSSLRLLPCLLLLACSGSPSTEEPAPDSGSSTSIPLPTRAEFVERGLGPIGNTRATLTSALGDPDSMRAEVVPNRHVPGVTDTIFHVHYPGLVARIHRPGPGGELLSAVDVAANEYLRYPIIGADREAVMEAFGPPDMQSDSTLTYLCTSCVAGDDPVELFVRGGGVERVRFNYYVD